MKVDGNSSHVAATKLRLPGWSSVDLPRCRQNNILVNWWPHSGQPQMFPCGGPMWAGHQS